jgi:hypothetical protein
MPCKKNWGESRSTNPASIIDRCRERFAKFIDAIAIQRACHATTLHFGLRETSIICAV